MKCAGNHLGNPPPFGESLDGEDVFGVPWIYIPAANGSIEDATKPTVLNDMSEWKMKLTFPDPDKWDWKGSAAANKEYLSGGYYNMMWQLCGFRERITSLLGFEECLMEFIDEDMQPHIHSFFEHMVEFYKKIIRNSAEVYDIDLIFFHDDWGTQRASFMSPNTTREMIAPYLKELVDYTHQCGLKFQLHSCGCNMQNVEIMIECGVDTYGPQRTANNLDELYRRYGDQIVLGITPDISPNATDAEVRDFAKKFMDKYGPDYARKPIYMEDAFFTPFPATLREYVYA